MHSRDILDIKSSLLLLFVLAMVHELVAFAPCPDVVCLCHQVSRRVLCVMWLWYVSLLEGIEAIAMTAEAS